MLASKINIGELDRRVTIQYKVITQNDFNEDQESGWDDVQDVWAKVVERTGNESQQADRLTTNRAVSFTIRWRSDIDKDGQITINSVKYIARIVYGGFAYDIVSVIDIGRKRFLEIVTQFSDTQDVS
jgi:SPP1 family predicted phage head-tail adaptor